MLKRLVVLTAAALLLLAGACGDDDDDDDGASQISPSTTAAGGAATKLTAELTGAVEVPGPGDPDGSGVANIELKTAESQVCFVIDVAPGIATASAAHIHEGASGVAGPIVVTLDPPANDNMSEGCKAADAALIGRIAANPAGFYVNIHNAEYPNGAIRGQLERES